MMDSDDSSKKPFVSQVKEQIQETPCMRTAFLYGIGGGLGVGLATFLFTSRVKRSADMGVFSLVAVTLGSFTYCRYNRAKMLIKQRRFRELQGLEPREVSNSFKPER